MEGPPGATVQGDFLITNEGTQTADIGIEVVDVQDYLTGFTPGRYRIPILFRSSQACPSFHSFQLSAGATGTVVATFDIPLSAVVGTVSKVIVTATSQLDQSSNFALGDVVVISNVCS